MTDRSEPGVLPSGGTPAPTGSSRPPEPRRLPALLTAMRDSAASVLLVSAGLLVLIGAVCVPVLQRQPHPITRGSLAAVTGALDVTRPLPAIRGAADAAHPPIEVRIPAIGVRSSLVGLRLDSTGALQTPTDFATVGWFRDGVSPGDPGPAVLVGHVDSFRGPAVFARLRELRPGMQVAIDRADGSKVVFAVDAVREYPKKHFPNALVYGTTTQPTMRLVTCGGAFNRSTGHYDDNVVVFAHLVTPASTR